MRGFLQRVAASVVRPQPTMHPFAESSYAARPLSDVELSPQPETIHVAAIPAQAASMASQMSLPATLNSVKAPMPHSIEPVEQGFYQPLVPELKQEWNAVRQPEQLFESRSLERDTDAAPFPARKLSVEPSHAEHSAEPAIVSGFVPIVLDAATLPEISADRKPLVASLPKEPHAATARAMARSQFAQALPKSQTREIQPEDIQIHIGRIEVIAVPPPAPRPAAAPARKGLSLDEYLSRNGRGR